MMLTAGPGDPLYEFGSFIADPVVGRLYHGSDHVLLTPKSFLVLMVLVESGGRLVDKSELFRLVWPDTYVEPNNLARNISMIRKVLHEHDRDQEYIVTVSRYGYRFVAPVTQISRDAFACHVEAAPVTRGIEGTPADSGAARPDLLISRSSDTNPAAEAAMAGRRPIRPGIAVGVAAAVILGVAGTLAFGGRKGAPGTPPERRLWQLTSTGRMHAEPTWSPDGQLIAYSSDRGGN
ncbi:MAG: winged helix-turn-helix domain-containing protein, partial [Vicinamibacterales bacterium]